ncbi:hypothetical protein WG899_16035 [Paucibacter sp. AS339]|uniref:hypothetical protein n=1 Tax=Paucibacter hankyongi TaxID=3133434 RepID=UPI0030B123DB
MSQTGARGRAGLQRLARGLALLCAVLAASYGQAGEPAEVEPMRWLVRDVPPYFSYVNGKPPQRASDLVNGEVDGFLRLLIEQLPQYRHEFVDAGFPRFEAMVRQQGQTLCSALHVRTPERLEWLYFTHLYPPLFSRQIHLIVRRDSLPKFEALGAAPQLAEVLQQTKLEGLLPRGRAYGPKIDGLLQARGELAPKTIVAAKGMHLLAMLRAGRMDYTLEYPASVDEFLRSAGPGPELLKIPLAEARSTTVATLACSRTPEGKRQIEVIDQAVRKLAQDPQREAWIRAWRGDSLDDQDRLRLKRYMDERARGGSQVE